MCRADDVLRDRGAQPEEAVRPGRVRPGRRDDFERVLLGMNAEVAAEQCQCSDEYGDPFFHDDLLQTDVKFPRGTLPRALNLRGTYAGV